MSKDDDQSEITIQALIPDGILPTDFLHSMTYDETCSRCRKSIPDNEVPLLVWLDDRNKMYAYCIACTNFDRNPVE